MHQPQTTERVPAYTTVSCPAQVLVIDRPNGPAGVLMGTISLLAAREVSLTTVDDYDDVVRALAFYSFDLVVIGLEAAQALQLSVLPQVRAQCPDVPVLVVGRGLPPLYRQHARRYGADDVIDVPQCAAELKALVRRVACCYLAVA
jgi:DNA-binding NtrC family response regulator